MLKFIMLMTLNSHNATPVVLEFSSMQACQEAMFVILKEVKVSGFDSRGRNSVWQPISICIGVPK